jgi:hypothetical protein
MFHEAITLAATGAKIDSRPVAIDHWAVRRVLALLAMLLTAPAAVLQRVRRQRPHSVAIST